MAPEDGARRNRAPLGITVAHGAGRYPNGFLLMFLFKIL